MDPRGQSMQEISISKYCWTIVGNDVETLFRRGGGGRLSHVNGYDTDMHIPRSLTLGYAKKGSMNYNTMKGLVVNGT